MISTSTLPCGCVVREEDGIKRLSSERSELCAWAWDTGQEMADACLRRDDMEETVRLDRALTAHAEGGAA